MLLRALNNEDSMKYLIPQCAAIAETFTASRSKEYFVKLLPTETKSKASKAICFPQSFQKLHCYVRVFLVRCNALFFIGRLRDRTKGSLI